MDIISLNREENNNGFGNKSAVLVMRPTALLSSQNSYVEEELVFIQ